MSSALTEETICAKYTFQDKLVDAVFELQHQVDILKRELKNVQNQLNNYQLSRDMATASMETQLTAEDKRIEEKLTTLTNGLPGRITSVMTGLCMYTNMFLNHA
ncbi:hypothetical protein DPMN_099118 [Dreissena polymorpha]|uniref:Uncharacterized protein n=1 Tax=Dreissena polymorpha TaxID=45954 RepID=A0A9D4R6Z2_DREPO|nr:hypothetical protein DPMN_099118 [Dreissena polymorpha]